MSYSFTKIEKDKSHVIRYAFAFLVLLYFSTFWLIAFLIHNYSAFHTWFLEAGGLHTNFLSFSTTAILLISAASLAIVQWLFTTHGLVERITRLLRAKKPDRENDAEQMFCNVVEEVSVATGGSAITPLVIPSMGLNACSYADGESAPVIAVTRGLLYKLTRPQLEAVVAHEAAHVVSADSEGVTVISAMFEIFAAFLDGIKTIFAAFGGADDDRRSGSLDWNFGSGRGRGSGADLLRLGPVLIFIVFLICIIALVNLLAKCMRLFISRQREYRADAVAVRLSRNPQALAEALYIISYRRRKLFDVGDSLETLFIINPRQSLLDEQLGLVPDGFSTHPPVEHRIQILMKMSRASEADLEEALKRSEQKTIPGDIPAAEHLSEVTGGWRAQRDDGGWEGPMRIEELVQLDWVQPHTMIKKMGTEWLVPLRNAGLYAEVQSGGKQISLMHCPACPGFLEKVAYEGQQILQCSTCRGALLKEDQMGVILHRREETFEDRIGQMASTLEGEPAGKRHQDLNIQPSDRTFSCEQCVRQHSPPGKLKRLFNDYYPVEVDKCMACGLTWFDSDEIEILQCMFERRDDASRRVSRDGDVPGGAGRS